MFDVHSSKNETSLDDVKTSLPSLSQVLTEKNDLLPSNSESCALSQAVLSKQQSAMSKSDISSSPSKTSVLYTVSLLHCSANVDDFLKQQRLRWLSELNDESTGLSKKQTIKEQKRIERGLQGISEDMAVWKSDWDSLIPLLADKAAHNELDSEWVALAPAAGLTVWRLVSALYAQQLATQGHIERAVLILVGCGMITEAVGWYLKGKMFAEAALLCQTRLFVNHPLTLRVFELWAHESNKKKLHAQAALSYLRARQPLQAIHMLLKDSHLPSSVSSGWMNESPWYYAAGFPTIVPAASSSVCLTLYYTAYKIACLVGSEQASLQVLFVYQNFFLTYSSNFMHINISRKGWLVLCVVF